MDLYRLSGDEQDLAPLDMDNVFTNCTFHSGKLLVLWEIWCLWLFAK